MVSEAEVTPAQSSYDNMTVPSDNYLKTSSSNPSLCIQSEDQVLDSVAPMMNDGKLDQDKGSTSATLEITVPPSVDCHESVICSSSMQIDSCTINEITISDEVGSNADPISVNVSDQTTSATAVRTEQQQSLEFILTAKPVYWIL